MVQRRGLGKSLITWALALGTLAACAPLALPEVRVPGAPLPDLGAAPELTNRVWLNTGAPLRLASLRGRVVLLDMWTFG